MAFGPNNAFVLKHYQAKPFPSDGCPLKRLHPPSLDVLVRLTEVRVRVGGRTRSQGSLKAYSLGLGEGAVPASSTCTGAEGPISIALT